MIDAKIIDRKGARKAQEIPNEVLGLLNRGEIETVNLTEWLAIDHLQLIHHTFSSIGINEHITNLIKQEVSNQKKPSTMNTTKLVGSIIYQEYKGSKLFDELTNKIATHQADSIRCYAPYLISLNEKLTIEEKLTQAQALAADQHFGVREVVWMALRPEIDKNLHKSIKILSSWTDNDDENIRRFATESTRPRGVWCKHIDQLKEQPEMALPLLEPLKSDLSKYVQDSVANWLNDASKTKPDFVIDLCERWQKESPTKETAKIVRRARRTIDKG